jgi:hypothetical protein
MIQKLPDVIQRGWYKFIRLQSQVTQKLFPPFGRDLNPKRWIFGVGCYNSGTSLLARILAEHPLIGGLPDEGIFFTDSLPYPEQFGWARMWIRCFEKVKLDPYDLPPKKIQRIKRQWSLYYPQGCQNLLEKSVSNATRLLFLRAHFQPAYFIGIIRNGYAVAEGIQRRVKPWRLKNNEFKDQYPIELCAEQWKACEKIVSENSRKLDRFKLISYEDLTASPDRILREITDFLDLPPMPTEVLNKSWSIRERNEPVKNMNQMSFQQLSESDCDAIESVAGDTLAKYGYQRPIL